LEKELASSLGETNIAEIIKPDEAEPDQVVGDGPSSARYRYRVAFDTPNRAATSFAVIDPSASNAFAPVMSLSVSFFGRPPRMPNSWFRALFSEKW